MIIDLSKPELFDERIIVKKLWLPKIIEHKLYWLEEVKIKQCYSFRQTYKCSIGLTYEYEKAKWHNIMVMHSKPIELSTFTKALASVLFSILFSLGISYLIIAVVLSIVV